MTCVVEAALPNWFRAAVAPTFHCAIKDTANGRAATHQIYSFTIEIWFGANGPAQSKQAPKNRKNKKLNQ